MLTFRGMLTVTVSHEGEVPELRTPEHRQYHHRGDHDLAELRIEGVPCTVLSFQGSDRTVEHHMSVDVTLDEAGALVLTEIQRPPNAPYHEDGYSSTQWFDALVGYELAMARMRVAADACQAICRNSEDRTRAHPVEIPAVTFDRMCDQIRAHQLSLGSSRHCL